MLNEEDREDGPEDGEYHFSDEGGYESNLEEEEAKAPVVSETQGLAAKFSSYRRFVTVGAVLAVVLFVAYLFVPSLTTTPSTDIAAVQVTTVPSEQLFKPKPVAAVLAEQATTTAAPNAAVKAVEETKAPAIKALTDKMAAEQAKLAEQKAKVLTQPKTQEAASVLTGTTAAPLNASAALPQTASSLSARPAEEALNQGLSHLPLEPGSEMPSMPPTQPTQETKVALEQLTAITETNAKLVGQLHAEYAKKLAEYEAQDRLLETQVKTLNARLAEMEAQMNKLVQAVGKQPAAGAASVETNSSASTRVVSARENNEVNIVNTAAASAVPSTIQAGKPNYTVQAIIPGRAWLRADSGETITVAEGDLLKNVGRVTKIDPYDGTIQIDTGVKVMVLTYGNGDYA